MPFELPKTTPEFGAAAPPVPQGVRQNLQPQRQEQPQQRQQQQRSDYGQQYGRGGDYRQYGQQRQQYRQPQQQRRQPEYSAYGGYGRGHQPYRQMNQPQPQQQQEPMMATRPQPIGPAPQMDEQMQLSPQMGMNGSEPVIKSPYAQQQYRVPQQQWGLPPIMPSTRYVNQGDDGIDYQYDAYNKRGY